MTKLQNYLNEQRDIEPKDLEESLYFLEQSIKIMKKVSKSAKQNKRAVDKILSLLNKTKDSFLDISV